MKGRGRSIDPLLVKAAQSYYQWIKAGEAGDPATALAFFDTFVSLQYLVRDQMAAEHGWARPYSIEQKAWADRQIFEVAVLALVRAELHREDGIVPGAALVLDSYTDRRRNKMVSLAEHPDGTLSIARAISYPPSEQDKAWRHFTAHVNAAKKAAQHRPPGRPPGPSTGP